MGRKTAARQGLLPGALDVLVLETLSIGVMHALGHGVFELNAYTQPTVTSF